MANPFVHCELASNDVAKAKEFYKGMFDWKLQEAPEMQYTLIDVGEGVGGGMMKNPVPNIPSHWMPYVLVDDINTSTEKAKTLGATVAMGPMDIPGHGRASIIIDPTGAALGLWQPGG